MLIGLGDKMKIERGIMPEEFDIGALINNDEIFELARKKLRPERYLDQKLKALVEIMIEHGNSIDSIVEVDRELAIYAMELSLHVSGWQIKLKQESYISNDNQDKKLRVKDMLIDFLPERQRKFVESESFKFMCQQLEKFLTEKNNYDENRQALKLARDNFEHYCEMKESL